jgi:hypothetical protein
MIKWEFYLYEFYQLIQYQIPLNCKRYDQRYNCNIINIVTNNLVTCFQGCSKLFKAQSLSTNI